MTQLSGTLDELGLPAILRFLTGLKKTGCLRVSQDQWHGEVFLRDGQVVAASVGSHHGLVALDALVQAVSSGSFRFDAAASTPAANIALSREALSDHLDNLAAGRSNGTPILPSLESVPEVASNEADASKGDEPVPLERGVLQTLLAVDGQRTVREIVALRGSPDAFWQIASLADVGLVRLESAMAVGGTTSSPPPRAQEPALTLLPPPASPAVASQTVACPKLGFQEDQTNSFGRPTRLHCCFASAAPLPLSLEQQRELCLTDQFPTCPRFIGAAAATGAPPDTAGRSRWPTSGREPLRSERAAVGSDNGRPMVGSNNPRATVGSDTGRVSAPALVARARAAEAEALADRAAVDDTEPVRFPSAGSAGAARPRGEGARDPSVRPGALRPRIEHAVGADANGVLAQRPLPPVRERRPGYGSGLASLPLPTLVGGGVLALALVAVLGFVVLPQLAGMFGDNSLDSAALPNTRAVVAGTPASQISASRATPLAVTKALPTPDAAALSLTSPVSAPAVAAGAASQAPAPAPFASAQPIAPGGSSSFFDDRFVDNAHNWPSNPQGSAVVANGSYHIQPRVAGQFVAIGVPILDHLQDVVVTATFHKLGGPVGGGYGIILRDQAATPQDGISQTGRFYVLEVGDRGEVGIWRREVDHWVDLVPWQSVSPANPGNGTNELSVRAVADRLSLAVNGIVVAATTDATLPTGGVGLFVGGDGNQVAVDHIAVQTP